MSYTAPTGNLVNFDFTNVGGTYTPPQGGAVNFNAVLPQVLTTLSGLYTLNGTSGCLLAYPINSAAPYSLGGYLQANLEPQLQCNAQYLLGGAQLLFVEVRATVVDTYRFGGTMSLRQDITAQIYGVLKLSGDIEAIACPAPIGCKAFGKLGLNGDASSISQYARGRGAWRIYGAVGATVGESIAVAGPVRFSGGTNLRRGSVSNFAGEFPKFSGAASARVGISLSVAAQFNLSGAIGGLARRPVIAALNGAFSTIGRLNADIPPNDYDLGATEVLYVITKQLQTIVRVH